MAQYRFSLRYQLDDVLFVKGLRTSQFNVTAVAFDIAKSTFFYTLNSIAGFAGEIEVKVGKE